MSRSIALAITLLVALTGAAAAQQAADAGMTAPPDVQEAVQQTEKACAAWNPSLKPPASPERPTLSERAADRYRVVCNAVNPGKSSTTVTRLIISGMFACICVGAVLREAVHRLAQAYGMVCDLWSAWRHRVES